MTFTSFNFYIFLLVLLCIYYLIPQKVRWVVLLVGSLYFYWLVSESSIGNMSLLVGSAILCWAFGLLIGKESGKRKMWMILAVILDALPLLIFKDLPLVDSGLKIVMPIGISYYTLQLISYSVDLYVGRTVVEKNPLKFLLFVSFFPQIVQGPIPRHSQLSKQLVEGRLFDERKFIRGFMLIIWGFFLKFCIADKLGIVVNRLFDDYDQYLGMYVVVASMLYGVQLYGDFLACSTIAQGIAGLFGIDIVDNFQRPLFASSIADFWRRWHLSFSSWLKDYIYIPLGGNRRGKVFKYINIIITFAISGFWHGTGFKYLVWGLVQGVYQIAGDMTMPARKALIRILKLENSKVFVRIMNTVVTYLIFSFSLIVFRADNVAVSIKLAKSIFTVRNPWILFNDSLLNLGLSGKEWIVLTISVAILFIVSLAKENGFEIREKILDCNIIVRWIICIAAILFIMIFGTYGYGFDSAAFIYGGF